MLNMKARRRTGSKVKIRGAKSATYTAFWKLGLGPGISLHNSCFCLIIRKHHIQIGVFDSAIGMNNLMKTSKEDDDRRFEFGTRAPAFGLPRSKSEKNTTKNYLFE